MSARSRQSSAAFNEPDEFVYRGGVSLGVEPRELMNVSVSCDFEGREDFKSHAFYANLRWRF